MRNINNQYSKLSLCIIYGTAMPSVLYLQASKRDRNSKSNYYFIKIYFRIPNTNTKKLI